MRKRSTRKRDPLSLAREISLAVREAGGRAFAAGGYVRDRMMARVHPELAQVVSRSTEIDLEVYRIPPQRLREILTRFGRVDLVGQAFGVLKVGGLDISLPRRENKIGAGHRGFSVFSDPWLSYEEACRRRDLTINSMLLDLLTDELIDPYGGMRDLERRLLRATDPTTFGEDPLRVLRVMQFAARFDFSVEAETQRLCRTLDISELPRERIAGEIEKWLLKSPRPSVGLFLFEPLGILPHFPPLPSLVGRHRFAEEIDDFAMTARLLDEAARRRDTLPPSDHLILMLSAWARFLPDPHGSEAPEQVVETFLRRFLATKRVIEGVCSLVAAAPLPRRCYEAHGGDGEIRRLSRRVRISLLLRLAEAEHFARNPGAKDFPAGEWLETNARRLGVMEAPPPPILQGRDLIEV
ncbi:MAG: hypothetical protein D6812_09845, partial [Deltaproteobacteria bacterium]